MIRIVDIYILRQVIKPLAGAMAIGLLVLLAERMVRLLDTILGKKNSFAVVFELLAYLVPHYLGLAVPAALFLGLLFGGSFSQALAPTRARLSKVWSTRSPVRAPRSTLRRGPVSVHGPACLDS